MFKTSLGSLPQKIESKSDVWYKACNRSTQEAEAGRFLQVGGQPTLCTARSKTKYKEGEGCHLAVKHLASML